MRKRLDINKLNSLACVANTLNAEYGAKGTSKRIEFDAKSHVWYYTEMVKTHRKSVGITQRQLAEKIGVSLYYISQFERGEVEIPLSTFIQLAEAIGLRFALVIA
jgi:DNA-binding XRE family transcriptional regulator